MEAKVVTREALRAGAKPKIADWNITLRQASNDNDLEMVRLALASGANVNAASLRSETPSCSL
jgi:hypothetical protein